MIELPSPSLVVLVGPAGSGKSTWAAANVAAQTVSSDHLRALVGEGEGDQRASVDSFAVLEDVIERRLRRRLTTVVDTLGNETQRRAAWRALADRYHMPCIAIVFDTPAARVRRQNRQRDKRVPDDVVRLQLTEWATVRAAVMAEPFDAVHIADEAMLVPPELQRPRTRPTGRRVGDDQPVASIARRVRIGLQIPQFTWPGGPVELGSTLRDIAQRAEQVDLDSVWVMDHFRQIPQMGPAWADMLESWTTLAHLAACTNRIRLGTLVTGITYRNVAHLAKIVATLDVLSGGRVTCGLGLGWFAAEHEAYGWELPKVSQRYDLLHDALRLLPQMWGPGGRPFVGTVLNVPDTSCYPRPLQAKVPLLVGGSGERRTLRLVAELADACNLFGDVATVERKVAVLHRHCDDVGRNRSEISVTHLSTVLIGSDQTDVARLVTATLPARVSAERHARNVNAGTVDQHVARISRLVDAGVDEVIVSVAGLDGPESLDGLAAVVERVRATTV